MDLQLLTEQYKLVQESRAVLFDFCKTLSAADLLFENPSFGRGGNIRNLLVHIVNTYEFWIANKTFKKNIPFTEYHAVIDLDGISKLFDQVNALLLAFLERYQDAFLQEIIIEINESQKVITPLKLFTHVITHEFHHKGQILSMSRHLGYIPVDTDIIR